MFQLTELTVFTHWINMTKFHQIHTIIPSTYQKQKSYVPRNGGPGHKKKRQADVNFGL